MNILYGAWLFLVALMARSLAESSLIGNVCQWPQLRAAAIQDALYVNGANQVIGFSASNNNAISGNIFALKFSQEFNTNETEFEALFTVLPTNDTTPLAVYGDGTMFANNEELYLYG